MNKQSALYFESFQPDTVIHHLKNRIIVAAVLR